MGQEESKVPPGHLEDLKCLTERTQYDENTIREWYREFIQDYPDGQVNSAKFIQLISKLFPEMEASKFCDHVFNAFDNNNDGFVDFFCSLT